MKRAAILPALCMSAICRSATACQSIATNTLSGNLKDFFNADMICHASAAVAVLLLFIAWVTAVWGIARRKCQVDDVRRPGWPGARAMTVAAAWLLVCLAAAYVVPKFAQMFRDMNLGAMPVITMLVVKLKAFDWGWLGAIMIGLVLCKGRYLGARDRRILDTCLGLAALAMFCAIGASLFATLICPVESI